jgi:hypothetical protein
MADFTAVDATVHAAIGRRHLARQQDLAVDLKLPRYVARAHDRELRRDIEAAAAGELRALAVVRGTSSTGKTRSLFEAVHTLCPGWTVVRPLDAAAGRGLPESKLLDRPVVVWLNEPQGFLGPNGQGLSVHVLEDLYAAASGPVVLVGTLLPDKLRTATDPETRRGQTPGSCWPRRRRGCVGTTFPALSPQMPNIRRARARQDRSPVGSCIGRPGSVRVRPNSGWCA